MSVSKLRDRESVKRTEKETEYIIGVMWHYIRFVNTDLLHWETSSYYIWCGKVSPPPRDRLSGQVIGRSGHFNFVFLSPQFISISSNSPLQFNYEVANVTFFVLFCSSFGCFLFVLIFFCHSFFFFVFVSCLFVFVSIFFCFVF